MIDKAVRYKFPDPSEASVDGLVAVGGNLSEECLLSAYQNGIFPWFNQDDPILWWSPQPRTVIFPDQLHLPRSTKRAINKSTFEFTFDTQFEQVIIHCAAPRNNKQMEPGTWITPAMIEAYCQLHKSGYAHSIECWQNDELVGGVYGVALGRIFFAESMFSIVSESSKLALMTLIRQLHFWNFDLLDCQLPSRLVELLGAQKITRKQFTERVRKFSQNSHPQSWREFRTPALK